MKAMVLTRFGGPDSFELRDLPDPRPGSRQIRVAVHATSINPLDYQIRRGDYADQVELPAIIGHDVSGVVDQIGSEVTEFRVGDEVYYTARIFGGPGSYAEYHVADVDIVARKPVNISHAEAASVSLVGVTVWEGLVERARLQVTETVLIHGGAGGVGAIAIQVAKAIGARVLATARGSDAALVERLGASAVIDFEREDYVDAVNRLTDGRGVDVVLDTLGRDTLSRSPRILREDGRVVTLVDTATPQNLIDAWGRNATYHFVFSRQSSSKLDALTRLIERGLVVPQVGLEFPLDEVALAHARSEKGRIKGKIVLRVRS
ncbi:NADPH:quinone oxidoreductase [Methylobacterium sp. Leaf94]|uniref:zinc-dependent alcohol dehydrogenase family protein n=1 Tax=Methylobacterium sp. Leaf94 TaxID=1736250 RepID=UPI0006F90193|nr:zinc-dependent alcohol dehydrogenase family protein [Methylobacterium sp. Leaf94]KQU17593.1 NADPH:quinone oxidoreductase [Methylobacterium sp. Leaf94]